MDKHLISKKEYEKAQNLKILEQIENNKKDCIVARQVFIKHFNELALSNPSKIEIDQAYWTSFNRCKELSTEQLIKDTPYVKRLYNRVEKYNESEDNNPNDYKTDIYYVFACNW